MNRLRFHNGSTMTFVEDDNDDVPENYTGEGYEDEHFDDFADPGGRSALRASSPTNPRNLPCPQCGAPDRLTPKDKALGYCCDACADRNEGGGYGRGDY